MGLEKDYSFNFLRLLIVILILNQTDRRDSIFLTVITLPKILRDRLTEEGAEAFVQIMDKVEERSQQVTLQIAEEKFERRRAQVEAKLENKIAESKAEIIKWMFIFWVGQVIVTFGMMQTLRH